MSANAAQPKFISKGKVVDSIPLNVRITRFINQAVQIVSFYLWTLFSINARNSLDTFKDRQSGSVRGRGGDQQNRFGRIRN